MSFLEKPPAADAEAVLVHDISPPHPRFKYFDDMVAETAEKTNGSLRIVINPGGRILYPGKSSLDAMRSGKVPLALLNSAHLASIDPRIGFINQPFAVRDDVMARPGVVTATIELMQELVASSGIRILALMRGADAVFIFKNRRINRPEDLKGLKIRVAGEGVFQDIIRSFSAEPIVLPPAENKSAVENGTVDGVLTSPGGWVRQFGLTAPFGTVVPGLLFMTYLMIADDAWFEGLPMEQRRVLVEAARSNVTENWGTFRDDDSRVIQEFTARGATCRNVPEMELPFWKEKVEWIIRKFSDGYPDIVRRCAVILGAGES
jgi:TRAP-type C4-dicarboxylate transport system substrate-binding protein